LIMEYVPGGDMMTILMKFDTFTEEQTRYIHLLFLASSFSGHSLSDAHHLHCR
jgi:hypothetical protein